jgi:hypothetical protein
MDGCSGRRGALKFRAAKSLRDFFATGAERKNMGS